MASGHRWLFDSDKRPSFVQKPYIVFLFKNLNTYKKNNPHTIHKMIFFSIFIYRNITFEASLAHNRSPVLWFPGWSHKFKICVSGHLETQVYLNMQLIVTGVIGIAVSITAEIGSSITLNQITQNEY